MSPPLNCSVTAGSSRSCGPLVLMDQPAEDFPAPYPCCCQACGRCRGARVVIWWPQVPGPVRPVLVVVLDVFIEDRLQVPRVESSSRSIRRYERGRYMPLASSRAERTFSVSGQ